MNSKQLAEIFQRGSKTPSTGSLPLIFFNESELRLKVRVNDGTNEVYVDAMPVNASLVANYLELMETPQILTNSVSVYDTDEGRNLHINFTTSTTLTLPKPTGGYNGMRGVVTVQPLSGNSTVNLAAEYSVAEGSTALLNGLAPGELGYIEWYALSETNFITKIYKL